MSTQPPTDPRRIHQLRSNHIQGTPAQGKSVKQLSEDAKVAAGLAKWTHVRLCLKYEEMLGGSQFARKDRERVEFINAQILAWTHFDLTRILQYIDKAENIMGSPSPVTILDEILNTLPGPQRNFPRLARCRPNCRICTMQWRDVISLAEYILHDWISSLPSLEGAASELYLLPNFGRRAFQTGAICDIKSLYWTRQWAWVRGPASRRAAVQLFEEPEDPVLKQWLT